MPASSADIWHHTGVLPDFTRHPVDVAPELIGCMLVGRGARGVIIETEAYHEEEASCHAHGRDPTERTAALYGPPGTAYVYFTYGMHWCANVVTQADGVGSAVLFRALLPVDGFDLARARRSTRRRTPCPDRELMHGPACLTQALDIGPDDNAMSLVDPTREVRIEPRDPELLDQLGIDPDAWVATPRIGISKATELPWRFVVGAPRV